VRRKVDTVRGAVQSCVGGRLPSLSVKVTLDPSGRITRVELVGQGSATGVSGCVTTAVSSVRFEPFTGEAVQVTHLFQFSAPSAPAGTGADAAHGPRFDEEYPE
jgi:hypothetical protein